MRPIINDLNELETRKQIAEQQQRLHETITAMHHAAQQKLHAANRAENDGKAGLKFDNGKQPWHRMPLVALEPLANVYCKAGRKYPAFNCLLPFENGSERLYDALMRHNVASQIDPLAKDPEDECYHLAKVAFCALTRLHNALYHSEK